MNWHEAGFQTYVLVAEDGEIVQTITRNFTGHWTVRSIEKTYLTMSQAKAQAMTLALEQSAVTGPEVVLSEDLGQLDQLAQNYATSYASPHHFVLSVSALRNLIAALRQLQS